MHCLKNLKTTSPGVLKLLKSEVLPGRVGPDLLRSQQPASLLKWAASSHTLRAFHKQPGPELDQEQDK